MSLADYCDGCGTPLVVEFFIVGSFGRAALTAIACERCAAVYRIIDARVARGELTADQAVQEFARLRALEEPAPRRSVSGALPEEMAT